MLSLRVLLLSVLWTSGGGYLVFDKPTRDKKDPKPQCVPGRGRGMFGASCEERELTAVPQYLSKGIELLDLTYNRIRELHNTSFVRYPYLRMLYLEDNIISIIEAGTFDATPDLELLHLGWNSLHQIPDAVYSLPILRKLYLSNNPFSGGGVHFMDPMRSLEILDLSLCKLTEMPQLEALPRLLELNISHNRIKDLSIEQLAPLCRIRDIHIQGNRLFSSESSRCDCVVLTSWTQMRHIRTTPQQLCRTILPQPHLFDNETCFTNETDLMFQESTAVSRACEAGVLEYTEPIRLRGSLLWTIGIMTACAVLLVCFGSVYFVRRRRSGNFQQRESSEELSITKSRS